jgi:hypothetical protein
MLSALLSALADGGFPTQVIAFLADTWTWGT